MTRDQSVPPFGGSAHRDEPDPLDPPDQHRVAMEVLSAAADGEQSDEVALRAARRHVGECPDCAAFERTLTSTAPGPPSTDRPEATVMGDLPIPVRVALLVAGLVNIAVGTPLLLGADPFGGTGVDTGHLTRDGALAVILGVVALVCARQPRFGRSLSPVALAIVAMHLLGGGTDVAEGAVTWTYEATHLVNAFTAGLVVAAALWTRPRRGAR